MSRKGKLTDEQVREIRRLYASKTIGYRILSRVFRCGQSTVRDIVKYWTRAGA